MTETTEQKVAQPVPSAPPTPSNDGPTELWLQLHGDCVDEELLEPVDCTNNEVSWCWHAIHDSDVRYVRADLARPVALGWKLVPVEPDLAMVIAGENYIGRHAYARMLSAAPSMPL